MRNPKSQRGVLGRRGRTSPPDLEEQRELEGLEAHIEALEAQKAALQAQINASGSDYVRLSKLAELLRAVEIETDAATERWLELAEEG